MLLRTHLSLELFHAPNLHPIGSNLRLFEEGPDFAHLGVVGCDNTDMFILYGDSSHAWDIKARRWLLTQRKAPLLLQRLNVRLDLCCFQYIEKRGRACFPFVLSLHCMENDRNAASAEPIPSQTGTCNDRVGTWFKFILVELLVGVPKDGVMGTEVFDKLHHAAKGQKSCKGGKPSTYVMPLICDSSYTFISQRRSR